MALRLARDTWERHMLVAGAVDAPGTVLDVGGRPGELAALLPDSRVSALNVDEPADVVATGELLPFDDESFDVVTSLDVLEHLPRERRRSHLEELTRVARRQVIACCPLGTDAHVAAERELSDWYVSVAGRPHRFLEEHLRFGLPTEEELRGLVRDLPFEFELSFHGDFRRTNSVFRASVRRQLFRYGREAVRPVDTTLGPAAGEHTNRVFLKGVPRAS
jgi:Methyltransferase domain